jgi:glucose-1-phosphate cytidylyltransferase
MEKGVKAVILAGGLGSRLSEETHLKPKPMVEIGGRPILWHIMKLYAYHGAKEFIVCLGYKGDVIKEFFFNYALHTSDVTFDLSTAQMHVHDRRTEPWTVTLVDTGATTMTGGRLRRVRDYLGDAPFCFTYGDGLCDADLSAEIAFHNAHGKLATVLAVMPPGRYGALEIGDNNVVNSFHEKPRGEAGRINGGFFVLDPKAIDYIDGDNTSWEVEPMSRIAEDGQLVAYPHDGFWQPMDTLREKIQLDDMIASGTAPWMKWA